MRDSRAYLIQYNDYMNVFAASDFAKCKAFSTMLKGNAKDWYLSLPQGSIRSFSQLGQMFLGQFRAYRTIMSTVMGLMPVKQKEYLYERAHKFVEAEEIKRNERNKEHNHKMSHLGRLKELNQSARGGTSPKVKSLGILFAPSPMRHKPKRLDLRDRCVFHDDRGHKTEDYFSLKDAIE
ncbi:uncharacterized protein [Gossypium hirsutum]|uniref:Retrotransposon gag domain-containing protein n=1 Tax=Gossypium hirsutum TaxID=3635 RepID=A0A1U8KBZ4_GOSHI|nr:uncharacterized protein LOC107915371 [Gossypium hirsutum]